MKLDDVSFVAACVFLGVFTFVVVFVLAVIALA